MTVLIGTSGWHYSDWRGAFYPRELPTRSWLGYYSERFRTVELNNAFYRLPGRESFETWAEEVPDDFIVAVKASRYLTHVRRLKDPAEPVARLMQACQGLRSKLGPVLVQLPPNLRSNPDALDATLGQFPAGVDVAVECRHPSWYEDDARRVLERRRAAWVLVDPADRRRPTWRTAEWGYLRLHHGRSSPEPCYGSSPLHTWAGRLADIWSSSDDVYCFFNNDGRSCAPRDARRFAAAVEQAGLRPSRVPGQRETRLAR